MHEEDEAEKWESTNSPETYLASSCASPKMVVLQIFPQWSLQNRPLVVSKTGH
jgi:hypothetical protein